ncbi:hypothetical protein C0991_010408, partial [Blastosporella zonata]
MSQQFISLVASEAVGYAATSQTIFNDLQDCGYWPAHQYISHVDNITVHIDQNPNIVHGIEITYSFNNGNPSQTVLHGNRT